MRGVCFSLFPLSSSPSLSSRALGKTEKNLSPCSSLASVRHPSVFDYTRALSSRERATEKEQPVKERKAKKESSSKLAATSTTIIQKRK